MNWKATSIVLFIIVVLESAFILWAWNLGTEALKEEEEIALNRYKCANVICYDYDSFYYDEELKLCECYRFGELKYKEFLE